MQENITLTDEETAIFDTLLAAAEFSGCKTVLRAAGGWVRDKLLGKDSADIDIALDNMLGKTFAEKVRTSIMQSGLQA
jgi:tRNA nucleotidyltransferase/poly(A) polymerase